MRQILAVIAVVVSISLGIYFIYNNQEKEVSISLSPTPTTTIQSPEVVVETFYSTYLNCLNNHFENPNGKSSIENCPFNLTGALSDSYAQTIQAQGADPILCAQDIPSSISVDPANIQGNIATTTVHERFETDNPVTVDLKSENNQWKITNITCHPPSF